MWMKKFPLFVFHVRILFALVLSLGALSCQADATYPDLVPIGLVQGKVPEGAMGERFRSPFYGETATIRGIVYQILEWKTQDGEPAVGFFVQNTEKDADRIASTSDGIFVYTGQNATLPLVPQGSVDIRVGDMVVLRGEVNERYTQTELSDAKVLNLIPKEDVKETIKPVVLNLPKAWSERQRYLEAHEGMRVQFPAGAVTVSGTHPHTRSGDYQTWVVGPHHPVAKAEKPDEMRLFQFPHPLTVVSEILKMDSHGDRLLIGSFGLGGERLPALYGGSRFKGPLTGGLQFSYREYILQPEALPEIEIAVPEKPALPDAKTEGLRIATYNVENLYDFVNDPFDDCDFQGDSGCPGTRFPLNYVPENDEIYRARLARMADQIVRELNAPDVLFIQEVEDQDIAKLIGDGLVYGTENNADGNLDALQELAREIVNHGGPKYAMAVDRDGTDDRGIICAWLYNPERLAVLPVEAGEILLGSNPELGEKITWDAMVKDASNPKAFNAVYEGAPDSDAEEIGVFSRSAQVLLLQDLKTERKIWFLNNHFSSGPDRRVERRRQQAGVNAQLVKTILSVDDQALVVAGGDLNVFPRPFDPLDPPSDQLGPLYDAGLFNVVERVEEENPANTYSYIYRGIPNVLDHFFLTPAAKSKLTFAMYVKLNASAPEAFPSEPPLRASDHDPLLIVLDVTPVR
jgi:predicted extracellular nuclease